MTSPAPRPAAHPFAEGPGATTRVDATSVQKGSDRRARGHRAAKTDRDEVAGELADVLTYALCPTDRLDLDPEAIISAELERTHQKYPVEKAEGRSTRNDHLGDRGAPLHRRVRP